MDALPLYNCASLSLSKRQKKIRTMRPTDRAGNTPLGKGRYASRRGGKIRGMKAGRQKQAKVNVASLVAKTNKKRG